MAKAGVEPTVVAYDAIRSNSLHYYSYILLVGRAGVEPTILVFQTNVLPM